MDQNEYDQIKDMLFERCPTQEIEPWTVPNRSPDARSSNRIAPNTSRCLTIPDASIGDVAVINITNTAAAGTGGYGALRAAGQTPIYNRPTANQYSSVNFAAQTPPNPNLAFVTIGTNKQICYDNQVSAAHVILDHAATIPANNINAFDPKRILDTRTPAPEPEPEPDCHPAYPDHCIPPAPPDLNCSDIPASKKPFTVLHEYGDPHRFDGNKDGRACTS